MGSSPLDKLTTSAPKDFARLHLAWSKSIASTLHPWALRSWTVKRPIKPNPVTTTVSPSVGETNLIPCKATDPKIVNDASSSETLSGIFAHKLKGTLTNS